jgi:hypothetical protein
VPDLRDLLLSGVRIFILLVLVRIEVLLARDVASKRILVLAFLVRNHCQRYLLCPFFGLLVFVPDNIILPVTILNFFAGAVNHFDVPISLGKHSVLFTGPQWHRIHHSLLPEHRDKNFANFFPIFDVLWGTAWMPSRDEFPVSGLDTGDKPASVFEGMIWPLRRVWRRMRSGEPDAAPVSSGT